MNKFRDSIVNQNEKYFVRRSVYPWTISPEPRKDLGSPTENYVRTADAIESRSLYVGHICLKRVIG